MANLSGRYRDAPLLPAPLRARPPRYQPSPPEATFATIDGPALTRHRPPEPRVYTGLRSWWYILWVWTNGEGHIFPHHRVLQSAVTALQILCLAHRRSPPPAPKATTLSPSPESRLSRNVVQPEPHNTQPFPTGSFTQQCTLNTVSVFCRLINSFLYHAE